MRTVQRFLSAAALTPLALAVISCGPGGNVYVGVGVAGPWTGPYGGYPGYVGRPPYYEEDALADDLQDETRYAGAAAAEPVCPIDGSESADEAACAELSSDEAQAAKVEGDLDLKSHPGESGRRQ
jgi:hypothetical protein